MTCSDNKSGYILYSQRDVEGLHYSDCGTTRACYREPYNCIGAHILALFHCVTFNSALVTDTDCDYAASWMVNSDEGYIEVEMTRNRRGWIALGFSDDNLMVKCSLSLYLHCHFGFTGTR